VANAYLLFNLVLKRFTLICGVSLIPMVLVVFGHVDVGWVQGFAGWRDKFRLKGFVQKVISGNT